MNIVNYNRLWKLFIDKNITKTEMRKLANVSTNVIAKMGKNETVSLDSLRKICIALNCNLSDILEMNTFPSEM